MLSYFYLINLPCLLYGDDLEDTIVLLLLWLMLLNPELLEPPEFPCIGGPGPICIGPWLTLACWNVYDSCRLMCRANGFMSPLEGTVERKLSWRTVHSTLCWTTLPWTCFFWRAREFWNHTWVTRLLSPVTEAIRSRSCPSGLLSMLKLACRICSCSSVKVVRTRLLLLLFCKPSASQPSRRKVISKVQNLISW